MASYSSELDQSTICSKQETGMRSSPGRSSTTLNEVWLGRSSYWYSSRGYPNILGARVPVLVYRRESGRNEVRPAPPYYGPARVGANY